MKFSFFAFILLFTLNLYSQIYKIKGTVSNITGKEKLAFVNITYDKNKGVITDLNGEFSFEVSKEKFPLSIKFSYVGYHDTIVKINKPENTFLEVKMKPKSFILNEVVILPSENPAHRIIKEAVKNRNKNNPEKSVQSFYYKSYNKMYFTAFKKEKIFIKGDTLFYIDTTNTSNDTNKTAKFLKKQHLFLIETVSERYYEKPNKNYEKILASRVSGFTIPTFIVLATQFQSFSFYNSQINLLDKKYLSPLSPNSWKKYLFQIVDTSYYENDTVFIIKFRPRKGKNFDGLKGVLYITSDGYALKNVIAEPVDQNSFYIKVMQNYVKKDSIWMPWQLNSNMIFNNFMVDSSYVLAGVNKTYLFDILINSKPDTLKPKFGTLDVNKEAFYDAEKKISRFRVVPLTSKDSLTYHLIDSIGKAEGFNLKYFFLTKIATGKVPYGFLNFDLNKLLGYNLFEKFRLGFGIETNEKLSNYFSLNGYYAYSFGIKKQNYGGGIKLFPLGSKQIILYGNYNYDLTEVGGYNFHNYRMPITSSESYRFFYLKNMEYEQKYSGGFMFNMRNLSGKIEYINSQRTITSKYIFNNLNGKKYFYNEAQLSLRIAFKEQVMNTPDGIFTLKTNFPLIFLNIHYGILNEDQKNDYTKIELLVNKTFDFNLAGKFTFTLTGGTVEGNLPLGMLYDMRGTNFKDKIFVSNTFQTMMLNSFYASRFFSGHFYYDFKNLLIKTRHFEPNFVLAYSMGVGYMPNYALHKGIDFDVPNKMYSEGGILINNILKSKYFGLGLGTFYKFGPYASTEWKNNVVIKFNLMFLFD